MAKRLPKNTKLRTGEVPQDLRRCPHHDVELEVRGTLFVCPQCEAERGGPPAGRYYPRRCPMCHRPHLVPWMHAFLCSRPECKRDWRNLWRRHRYRLRQSPFAPNYRVFWERVKDILR